MLEKHIICDVTLSAGNGNQPIQCHKCILASRSPVFEAMFCGPLAESKQVIEIPDIEESVLSCFVRYMYSGMVDLTNDTVMHILYAAKKYDVSDL
ncbi:hypothetical protein DPMN_144604 [Dreissena polymorpha]|uniref:BTB domain-containing protein n=2 Tax=Dreissena polymorpha TaxID=45954 RepID=A0A9D4F2E3_DREPO|nr:hypothetical protein DPMN_144604 [Dreissena polymorpha]